MSRIDRGLECGPAGELLFPREGDEQNGIRRGNANRHDRAHQGGHTQARAGDEQHRDDSAQRRRKGQNDDEWIGEILVIHEHEQIDQHGGEQQSEREIPE